MRKRVIKFKVLSFQSCRPKDPSSLLTNPDPSFSNLAPATSNAVAALKLNHRPPLPPSKHPRQSFIKRHVSSALLLARRSFLPSRSSRVPSRTGSESSKWHVINKVADYECYYHFTPPRPKIYTSAATSDDCHYDVTQNDIVLFPPLTLKNRTRRSSRRRRRTRTFHKVRTSTSSDGNDVIFSDNDVTERGNETDTLVSTDDSASHRRRRNSSRGNEPPAPAPARLSEFMRGMVTCQAVEGKVRESFAVVKRSEEPYEDFKRSMAEMVVEKELFEMVELEELLRCYLSLNSNHHHDVIIRAFSEIWEAMFNIKKTLIS